MLILGIWLRCLGSWCGLLRSWMRRLLPALWMMLWGRRLRLLMRRGVLSEKNPQLVLMLLDV